jgi:hypothetical protein
VQRAEAHDFCWADGTQGVDGNGALPSRVLLDAPREGEYLK